MSVRWRAFPLHPETPEEGVSLKQLFAGRTFDIQENMHRLSETAKSLGLPFGESGMIYNSRLAQELGLWAESQNAGDAFHSAVFKAYFVDGKNIARIPVLVELASSVGLPVDEANAVLATRAFKTEVDADWELSREKAVTAVPTLVMNQDRLVGAQPYEAMRMLLETNGIKKKTC